MRSLDHTNRCPNCRTVLHSRCGPPPRPRRGTRRLRLTRLLSSLQPPEAANLRGVAKRPDHPLQGGDYGEAIGIDGGCDARSLRAAALRRGLCPPGPAPRAECLRAAVPLDDPQVLGWRPTLWRGGRRRAPSGERMPRRGRSRDPGQPPAARRTVPHPGPRANTLASSLPGALFYKPALTRWAIRCR